MAGNPPAEAAHPSGIKGEAVSIRCPAGRSKHVVHHLRSERVIRFPATGRLNAGAA